MQSSSTAESKSKSGSPTSDGLALQTTHLEKAILSFHTHLILPSVKVGYPWQWILIPSRLKGLRDLASFNSRLPSVLLLAARDYELLFKLLLLFFNVCVCICKYHAQKKIPQTFQNLPWLTRKRNKLGRNDDFIYHKCKVTEHAVSNQTFIYYVMSDLKESIFKQQTSISSGQNMLSFEISVPK